MFDPLAFMNVVPDLEIRLKQGGTGRFGDYMRPNQQEFYELIQKKRAGKLPTQFIWLKSRQFAAMTTTVGGLITGDTMSNDGLNSVVTAHTLDSLDEISQVYRHFFGRTKKQGVEQKRAERMADRLFVSPNGSRIKMQVADEDLGRSGNLTGLHVSEAGYIDQFTAAWQSVQPALSDAWWRVVVMETTFRRGYESDLRTLVEEVLEGKHKPWEAHFTAWHATPELRVQMSPRELVEFRESCPEYERLLVSRHKLSWEQARWYYDTRIGGMFGDYDAMAEAYPTTIEEILASTKAFSFFDADAMKFHDGNVRPPVARFSCTPRGLVPFDENESKLKPHLEVWQPPMNATYVIGADCADSDERIAVEGSENALVVVDQDTGDVVAHYHGYSNAHEFAHVLDMVGRMYNNAQLVVEANNAGRAVIDQLRAVLHYPYLYQRETFRGGTSTGSVDGLYGFDTRGHTRPILLDRLQLGVNKRLFNIPSRYLVDCLNAMGRRQGKRVHKKGSQHVQPDDGAIALGLTTFGHRNLIDQNWRPKSPWVITNAPLPPKRVPGGIRIEQQQKPRLRWDSVWNCWR